MQTASTFFSVKVKYENTPAYFAEAESSILANPRLFFPIHRCIMVTTFSLFLKHGRDPTVYPAQHLWTKVNMKPAISAWAQTSICKINHLLKSYEQALIYAIHLKFSTFPAHFAVANERSVVHKADFKKPWNF